MKIKTAELIAEPLDWAVAKIVGKSYVHNGNDYAPDGKVYQQGLSQPTGPHYSTDRSQAGPIMDREKINIQYCRDLRDRNGLYIYADRFDNRSPAGYWRGDHKQPLVAAMRCFVASRLGEEVDVPDELVASVDRTEDDTAPDDSPQMAP